MKVHCGMVLDSRHFACSSKTSAMEGDDDGKI
jgi:hypothetical protein